MMKSWLPARLARPSCPLALGNLDACMPLQAFVLGDASAAERCIKAGWIKATHYIHTHPCGSTIMLHDLFENKDSKCSYPHTASETNTADLFTKALPASSFQTHVGFLGIRRADLNG